ANEAVFTNRYPGVKSAVRFFAAYDGGLDNGGERLALLDSEGRTVTSVRYNDKDPWPAEADGDGFSLVPADTAGDQDDAAKWRASNLIGGSPGYEDGPSFRVVISEALTHTDPPKVDAIELHNAGSSSADIGGWYLSDSAESYRKFQIPSGTTLAAGGYKVFYENLHFGTNVLGPVNGFALSSHGDEVYLTKWDANGNLQYLAEARFGGAENGVAFGRYVTTEGEPDFVAQSVADTLGAANAAPKVGPVIINEIMYHPLDPSGSADATREFIELVNISASPVNLYDAAATTNRWRLDAAVEYTFPAGITLSAGEYVLVVPTNEAAFRAAYPGVPAGVRVFGPYAGRLANGGESVKLWRPDTPDAAGTPWILVDRVKYNDNSPWPESADGGGPSLERQDRRAYGNDPANWTASENTGGTPGGANSGSLVSKAAGWIFHDRGENLGTAWRAAAYTDSGWQDGNAPLGYANPGEYPELDTEVDYGDNPANKPITTYLRKRFTLGAEPANVTSLTLNANYDDGFVAYLNGQEVARSASMPGGTVAYDTAAASHTAAGYETFNLNAQTGKLVQGLNVLAVELHQAGATSSDLFIDLELLYSAVQGHPPAAPSGLAATAASASRIDLRWTDNSHNETGFRVDRRKSGTSVWEQVGTSGAGQTTYSDTGLAASSLYYYTVLAYNADGHSAPSAVAGATTQAGPPAAPSGLAAVARSATQIDVSWTDNSGNETGFKLERRTSGETVWTELGSLAADTTQYSDSGLAAATTYYYRVAAFNGVGPSPLSNVDGATTAPESFTAYNDLGWFSGQPSQNITLYTRAQSGTLVDYASGRDTGVQLALDIGGAGPYPQGADPAAGTDAAAVFGGKLDCLGLISYGADLTLTLTGLDPALRYEVVLFGNRDNTAYTDRFTTVTLSDADGFANQSTPGTTCSGSADPVTTVWNGGNTRDGLVVRYARINAGTDGDVRLVVSNSGSQFYLNALMLRAERPGGQETNVKVPKGAAWRYREGTREASTPASAWRDARFVDSGWPSGAAPFGYGDGPYGTTLTMRDVYTSLYLRRTFVTDQPSLVSELKLDALYDDGFVVWVNGQELARVNVPGAAGDPVAYGAVAASSIEPTAWSGSFAR
ncbi:MAG: lamin tail domain-containing protein, partial [Kiritimatiellae bacterium]|nr:lamin tail domain-containing protein [Kiritimatiellia bacterium]